MQVYLNKITGVDDALTALMMSKRTWTREAEREIRNMINCYTNLDGFLDLTAPQMVHNKIETLIKWGVTHGHTTLLRYIDISITVEGLHRGAQDDFDSHAARLDSRIVRASTRLAIFEDGEKSDWYQDKILYPLEAFRQMSANIPESFTADNGFVYVLTDFGYIREDLRKDKDAKRGLYPLAIPSNFIFKTQYPELCHIVQHRDNKSHANPELKEMIEQVRDQLLEAFPALGQNLNVLKMQMP